MFSDRRIFTAKHQPIYIKIHRFELHVRCDCVWIVWVISKWTKVGFKKDHIFPIHRFVIIAIFPSNGFQVMEPEWCVRDSNFVTQSAYSYYLFGVCILCIRFFMSLCAFACVLYEFESTFRNEIWFSSIFFVPLLANKNIIEMPMARRMTEHKFQLIATRNAMPCHAIRSYRFWISESNDRTNKEIWTKELNVYIEVSNMHHPW